MFKTCCICLETAEDLSPMTYDEIKMYKLFVPKVQNNENNMKLCMYCKWTIRKFIKLTQQWQTAYEVLIEGVQMDTKVIFLRTPHKFITTSEHHYLGPDDEISDDNDVDEVPLIMLSKSCRKKKKKRRKHLPKDTKADIKTEIDMKECVLNDGSKDQNQKRPKKEPLDGFTTRMVRETNEYVVIKLTKDQVLEEMFQRSTSESYARAAYKCDKCVKGFNFEDVLNSHAAKHSPENGSFQCDICTQYCPSAVSLRGHIKSHTTRYKCKICGYVRLSRQHLLEHHAISHTSEAACYRCDSCQFVTNKRTVMQRHVKSHSSERHTCHQCGKNFKTIMSLRVHTIRHDKSRGFQCQQCDKTFIYPSVLHKHIQAVHERDDYYCVECDVKFKSPETLKHHFKKAKRHRDSSSYKYVCEQCPAQFAQASSLAAHAHAAHGAGRAHECAACARAFSSRETLRAHVWRQHARAAHHCHVCGNTFSRLSSLKSHLRTHAEHTNTQKQEDLPNEVRPPETQLLKSEPNALENRCDFP
ncbi:zinc finger protein 845 isoform X2 [Manduca sexta]|uniref:zinc finger protein 845 isoform X2 n=1 Tax=Manduca sexta TaxID=7130 RepID=UPI00188F354D|nr:zinc finger protein 845 isoform X2 [Manduca sexta]